MGKPRTLEGMPFGENLPALETARILNYEPEPLSVLDFSGCRQLTRLVLKDVLAFRMSRPPKCELRVDLTDWYPRYLEAGRVPDLSEVHELLIDGDEVCLHEGLVAKGGLPELEVVRCDPGHRNDDDDDSDDNDDDDEGDDHDDFDNVVAGSVANLLAGCFRQFRSLPALKTIICGESGYSDVAMKACILANLAGVRELMIAIERPLRLVFECGRITRETFETFFAVASEVRVGTIALLGMTHALSKRGLTLSMAEAEKGHEHFPSQCLYIHACSAPQLSYVDAIRLVDARMHKWGRTHKGCGRCSACFKCLKEAGVLDSI